MSLITDGKTEMRSIIKAGENELPSMQKLQPRKTRKTVTVTKTPKAELRVFLWDFWQRLPVHQTSPSVSES